jgi:hypothetical protein
LIDQIGVIYQGVSQININKNIINFVDGDNLNNKMNHKYGFKFGSWYAKIVSCLDCLVDLVYGLGSTAWNKFNENLCLSFQEKNCPSISINFYREDIVELEDKEREETLEKIKDKKE